MTDIIFNDFTYLEKYKSVISQKEFWSDVNEQLSKDFSDAFSLIPDERNGFQGEQIAEIFVKAMEKELPSFTPRLSEILYRIDISEEQLAALKEVPGDIYYRCLAEIILKRVILKVAIRKYYSANKD